MYDEIEKEVLWKIGLYYSNLHSEGNAIVKYIEEQYYENKTTIKNHFGADDEYELIENPHPPLF